jgi:hypothetical protein
MTGAPWTGRERAALALNAVLVLVLCTTWAANEQACDLPPGAPPHGVNAGAAGDAAQALVQAMEEEDGRGSAGQDASSGAGGWSQPPPPPPPPVTVNLNSSLGSALLVDGSCLNEHFLRGLANHFATQANQAMCGIATAIMLLNALALPRNAIPTDEKYSPYSYFTVDSFFQNVTLLTASDVTRPPGGVGMQDMPLLLRNYAHADSILASDIPNGVAGLRRILRTHMAQQGRFLAVNYHRRAGLQQVAASQASAAPGSARGVGAGEHGLFWGNGGFKGDIFPVCSRAKRHGIVTGPHPDCLWAWRRRAAATGHQWVPTICVTTWYCCSILPDTSTLRCGWVWSICMRASSCPTHAASTPDRPRGKSSDGICRCLECCCVWLVLIRSPPWCPPM